MTNVLKGSISDKKTDQLMKIYGLQWVIEFFFSSLIFEPFSSFILRCPTFLLKSSFFAWDQTKIKVLIKYRAVVIFVKKSGKSDN